MRYKDGFEKMEAKKKRKEKLLSDMARLQKITAKHFRLPIYAITAKNRHAKFVLPRQIALFLAKEYFHYYPFEIGEYFQRNHTTAIYAYYKIKKQMDEDTSLKDTITQLTDKLSAHIVTSPDAPQEQGNKIIGLK